MKHPVEQPWQLLLSTPIIFSVIKFLLVNLALVNVQNFTQI